MALKDFDMQKFMLEKGERVGLGVAAVVMIGLIVMGLMYGLEGNPPAATAAEIKQKAEGLQTHIRSGPAGQLPGLPDVFGKPYAGGKLKDEYLTSTSLFLDTGLEDKKRMNPAILLPEEYRPQLVRAQVLTYMINGQKMAVLIPLDPKVKPKLSPQQQAQLDAYLAYIKRMGGKGPAGPGINPGVMPAGEGVPNQEFRLEWVPIDKMPKDARPASNVAPHRMVIVTAGFPYRKQLELYRHALRQQSVADLAKGTEMLPRFLGFSVRRRTLDARGKVKEDWKELNFEQDFGPVVDHAVGIEPDPPDVDKVIFSGLVMDRPILARGNYPDLNLGLIAKTLRVLADKGGPAVRVLNPLEQKLADRNLFSKRPMGDDKAKPIDKADDKKELILPDHCLVRFIDVTVKPGLTYEYQLQLKAANPNLGKRAEVAYPSLADVKELSSAWGPEPGVRITMPPEQFVYGYELDALALKIRTARDPSLLNVPWVQIHKWIESTTPNAEQARSVVPVGDWVVGDVPVRAGDYIGRIETVELPVWIPFKDGFFLGAPMVAAPLRPVGGLLRPPVAGAAGIPVNFTTEEVLVDWEGGTIRQKFQLSEKQVKDANEEANVEMLIVAPDGKLRVRNSRLDKNDTERAERHAEYLRWVKEVKENKGGKVGGGKADPFGKK